MSNEKMINVPLDDDTKAALVRCARANGRAVGREAAQLIKAGLATPAPMNVPIDTLARPHRRARRRA